MVYFPSIFGAGIAIISPFYESTTCIFSDCIWIVSGDCLSFIPDSLNSCGCKIIASTACITFSHHPDGHRQVMAEIFPHPKGLLYFDLYWHESYPDTVFHIVKGTVTGEGP